MPSSAGAPARILVVDDDDAIVSMLVDVLGDEGYDVATAPNGHAALQVARATHPDLVLLDWGMPVLDGPGFAAAYRQTPPPHAKLIVCTAAASARVRCEELGADGCLPKPFDVGDLLQLVADVLGE